MNHRPLGRSAIAARFTVCFLFTLAAPLLFSAGPTWWHSQGVIPNTGTARDYAALNQGQLRSLARAARSEMILRLGVEGPGPAIDAMIAAWEAQGASAKDYSVMNIGQLKSVGRQFRDRINQFDGTTGYPWSPDITDDRDHAIANLGQAKTVFNFTVRTLGSGDTDGDGLPDAWELAYGLAPLVKSAVGNYLATCRGTVRGFGYTIERPRRILPAI